LIQQLRRIPTFVWLLLAQAWLLINVGALLPPEEASRYQIMILVYITLTLGFVGLTKGKIPFLEPMPRALLGFTAGFVLSIFALKALEIPLTAGILTVAPLYLLVFNGAVIAASEEVIFRACLPKLTGPIFAQGIFAVFHWAAYGGAIMWIGFAFVAGLVFFAIAVRLGLSWAIGIHTGWNLSLVL
jgi:hypothetical protein